MRPGFGHCVSRIAEAKTTLESERKFVEGKVALGLRGTACFLLDFCCTATFGPGAEKALVQVPVEEISGEEKHCFFLPAFKLQALRFVS